MYRKYSLFLLLCNGILLIVVLNMNVEKKAIPPKEPEKIQLVYANLDEKAGYHPVVQMNVLERSCQYDINREEYEILLKIVEAEAGGEDLTGKILVANVILNRVKNENFPNTIKEVVFQRDNGVTQFSPIANGKYETAIPGDDTKEAVERALYGEDYSEGALYFVSRQYADPIKMQWFDEHLTSVLKHGGHEFYTGL